MQSQELIDPPSREQIVTTEANHVTEAGQGRLNAQSQENARGFKEHPLREVEGHVNNQGVNDAYKKQKSKLRLFSKPSMSIIPITCCNCKMRGGPIKFRLKINQ
jgi:hypothetical protein